MIEAAGQVRLVAYLSLLACLFIPFGMATPGDGLAAWLAGALLFLLKIGLGATLLGVWEVSIAKMRVFRVTEFIAIAFIFAFLAILLAFLSREVLQ
jgi:formate hydrogenlyase subunit 4